jgi:hypothetical protein
MRLSEIYEESRKQRLQTSQAIDFGFVRLTPSSRQTSSSEQRFSKDEYTYGWYSTRPEKLIVKQIKSISKFN